MKSIPLSQGKVALVDDEDYEWLSRWKWCVKRVKHKSVPDTWYAVRSEYVSKGQYRTIQMHRLVMNAPDDVRVDHRSYDGLDNQRENLRLATNQQNTAGRRVAPRALPRGVSLVPQLRGARFSAAIVHDGKSVYLGLFNTPQQAGEAYRAESTKLNGEFSPVYDLSAKPAPERVSRSLPKHVYAAGRRFRVIFKGKDLGYFDTVEEAVKVLF